MLPIVALYAAAIYLPFLGSDRTLTRHEVIVSLPALHMVRDGHWIVPRYADRVWVDKPPLVSWMIAGLFELGGFNEWTARLPPALASIGLCVLVAGLARRFFDPLTALLAGLIQASSVYMYMQGRLGEIDLVFALLIAAAHSLLLCRWRAGRFELSFGAAASFHALAALAVLAKGPLAVALLGAPILALAWLVRSWQPIRAVVLTPAVAVFIGLALWWYVVVWLSVGNLALARWGYNYFDRISGLHHLGTQSPLVYLWAIPWLTLPWGVVLLIHFGKLTLEQRRAGRGIFAGARVSAANLLAALRRPDSPAMQYLWLWFLAGLVPLVVSAFKHKHYCIPILPPLSIIIAKLMADHARRVGRLATAVYSAGFLTALVALTLVSGVIMPRRDHRRPTVEFVRQASGLVPSGTTLNIIGLAQSAVYPYVPCEWEAFNDAARIEALLKRVGREPVWILTTGALADAAAAQGVEIETVAAEPLRPPKYPREQTLVLGRVVRAASQPVWRMGEASVDDDNDR